MNSDNNFQVSGLDTPGSHRQELHKTGLNDQNQLAATEQIVPDKLPWIRPSVKDGGLNLSDVGECDMDSASTQYLLHSNTKFHQLGGNYESYSVSK